MRCVLLQAHDIPAQGGDFGLYYGKAARIVMDCSLDLIEPFIQVCRNAQGKAYGNHYHGDIAFCDEFPLLGLVRPSRLIG